MTAGETTVTYARYGLGDLNPYQHRTLDPVTQPRDRELQSDLGGFLQRELIESYLKKTIAEERPAFVVVSGHDRSGRTSTANHVLDVYRRLRPVSDRFLVARLEVRQHDEVNLAHQVMAKLQNAAFYAGVGLSPETNTALEGSSGVDPKVFRQHLQRIARRVDLDLAGLPEPYAFGLCFEGLLSAGLISDMKEIFESTRCVVVFTHQNREHAQTAASGKIRSALSDDGLFVGLRPLAGSQVRMLAESRWRHVSDLDCPFDLEGVEEVFAEPAIPIKLALNRLEWCLEHRLKSTETDGTWPDDTSLALTRRWLKTAIAMVDSYPR